MTDHPIRIAILDLYDNQPNEGMRALRELLSSFRFHSGAPFFDVTCFETRYRAVSPDLSFDIYISSGGPGSPFDGAGKRWEQRYFSWLDALWNHNERGTPRKHALFICHSFQIMCRFFSVAEVTRRRSQSFGIFPVHKTEAGDRDLLFEGLGDPFYAADFRHWQVLQPDHTRLEAFGAAVLALEKKRPHVALERAVMGIRMTPELVGLQFHPEADPPGMTRHFLQPKRRREVIAHHGEEKYERILRRLSEPNALIQTHDTVIPRFLAAAVSAIRPEASWVRAEITPLSPANTDVSGG